MPSMDGRLASAECRTRFRTGAYAASLGSGMASKQPDNPSSGPTADGRPRSWKRTIRATGHAGILLLGCGAVAWASGMPFVFPSLGPSAYALATAPDRPTNHPKRLVGGHLIGTVAGLLSYHMLAEGLVMTGPFASASIPGLRLAASSVTAVVLTTAGMLVSDLRHSPACATTLIVAVGLLPGLSGAGVIAGGVVLLAALHGCLERLRSPSS